MKADHRQFTFAGRASKPRPKKVRVWPELLWELRWPVIFLVIAAFAMLGCKPAQAADPHIQVCPDVRLYYHIFNLAGGEDMVFIYTDTGGWFEPRKFAPGQWDGLKDEVFEAAALMYQAQHPCGQGT